MEAGKVLERETVARFIEEHAIHTLELGVPDSNGGLRGKRVPAGVFLEGGSVEVAMSSAVFALDVAGDLVSARYTNLTNGFPDVRMLPDLATLRALPWRPGTAFMMCDCVEEDGSYVEVAPRRILANVVAGAHGLGYEPIIGPELEFYLLDAATRAPDRDRIPCYSLQEESRLEPVLADIRNQLSAAGVVITASNVEYAPGQFEVNLRHCGAVEAADATMLLRYAVKQIAAAHGLVATFMAKPFSAFSGNGFHVHQSLWSGDGNLFASDRGGELSRLGRHYVDGLRAHIADLTALGAPHPNAYKRRTEYSFAPVNASWGPDNRTVAIRIPRLDGSAARAEQRDAAADANPYLVIAGQIAAGLDGIRRALEPGPMIDGNGYEAAAPEPLPATLSAALDRFETSALARALCGEDFREIFVALGRRELELQHAAVTDWEQRRYLETS